MDELLAEGRQLREQQRHLRDRIERIDEVLENPTAGPSGVNKSSKPCTGA